MEQAEVTDLGGGFWEVWSPRYGRHTDSGDMGYVQRTEDGFEAMSRGDIPRSLGTWPTLGAAVDALRAAF